MIIATSAPVTKIPFKVTSRAIFAPASRAPHYDTGRTPEFLSPVTPRTAALSRPKPRGVTHAKRSGNAPVMPLPRPSGPTLQTYTVRRLAEAMQKTRLLVSDELFVVKHMLKENDYESREFGLFHYGAHDGGPGRGVGALMSLHSYLSKLDEDIERSCIKEEGKTRELLTQLQELVVTRLAELQPEVDAALAPYEEFGYASDIMIPGTSAYPVQYKPWPVKSSSL